MNILLSGGSGFLGRNIRKAISAETLFTVGRSASDYITDLSCNEPRFNEQYDVVIHAAGKAHSVPTTESEKREFFVANLEGAKNLLKGLERASLPKSFVFISSVAVYGLDSGIDILESTSLGARDPYGLSKILAEDVVQDWCVKNCVKCTILRLPLLAGPNPPGNLRAMITAIQRGYYVDIGKGIARKSIVLSEDVSKIVLKAAEIGGIYNLTDGYHPSFSELSELIATQLGRSRPARMPIRVARVVARVGDLLGPGAPINSEKLKKITSTLTFDDSKAREILGWKPVPVLEGFMI